MSAKPEPSTVEHLAAPVAVVATRGEQCGFTIWGGACPSCGKKIWLNDLGRILCQCGTHLKYAEAPTAEDEP